MDRYLGKELERRFEFKSGGEMKKRKYVIDLALQTYINEESLERKGQDFDETFKKMAIDQYADQYYNKKGITDTNHQDQNLHLCRPRHVKQHHLRKPKPHPSTSIRTSRSSKPLTISAKLNSGSTTPSINTHRPSPRSGTNTTPSSAPTSPSPHSSSKARLTFSTNSPTPSPSSKK